MQRVSRQRLPPTVPMLRCVGPAMTCAAWATTGYFATTCGWRASSLSVTEAPISSFSRLAWIVRNSATPFISMSTGGASMPRLMFTRRSVPPPIRRLAGCAARAASTSAIVVGRSSWNSGRASISSTCGDVAATRKLLAPPLRACGERWEQASLPSQSCAVSLRAVTSRALPLLDRLEYAVGRDRQVVEADADRIRDGIGERRQEGGERAFPRFFGAEGPVRIVALDDAHLDRWGVLDGGHAVVEHVGHQHEAVVVAGLLAHRLAHPHPHRALHLAFHREAVERLAAVVRHPHLVDRDDAGLLVDAHLDDLRRVAVAHGAADRGAAIFPAALGFGNGGIVPRHRDGAGVLQGLGHHLVEGEALVLGAGAIELAQTLDIIGVGFELARGGCYQQPLQVLRRLDRRIADHEGDARRI